MVSPEPILNDRQSITARLLFWLIFSMLPDGLMVAELPGETTRPRGWRRKEEESVNKGAAMTEAKRKIFTNFIVFYSRNTGPSIEAT